MDYPEEARLPWLDTVFGCPVSWLVLVAMASGLGRGLRRNLPSGSGPLPSRHISALDQDRINRQRAESVRNDA